MKPGRRRWMSPRLCRGKVKRLNQLLVRLGQAPVKEGSVADLDTAISLERSLRRERKKTKALVAKSQKKRKGGNPNLKRSR